MPTFLQFQIMVERLLNHKIISVQSDWGGEYRNLHQYFQYVGITHRLSCPHTHQQQGCVERKHRHLIDTTLALLTDSHLPQKYWDEACLTSFHFLCRSASCSSTLYENSVHEQHCAATATNRWSS
jgi:hypothetical protein